MGGSSQQQRHGGHSQQQPINLQVFRVDNIIAHNPQAIKEALTQVNKPTPAIRPVKNALHGIDLSNHAGVVIVDYLPEPAVTRNHSKDSNAGHSDADDDAEENNDDNDGFQQVMTKKGKKAEKLKAAQAAAAAAAAEASKNSKAAGFIKGRADQKAAAAGKMQSAQKQHQKPVLTNQAAAQSERKTPTPPVAQNQMAGIKPIVSGSTGEKSPTAAAATVDTDAKPTGKSIMTNIETWQNEMAAPEAPVAATGRSGPQKYNQIVNKTNAARISEVLDSVAPSVSKGAQDIGPLSPSVDLNLKIESCKKVWETSTNAKPVTHKKESEPEKRSIASPSTVEGDKPKPSVSVVSKEVSPKSKSDEVAKADKRPAVVVPATTKQVSETTNSAVTVNSNNKSVCTVKPTQQQQQVTLPPSQQDTEVLLAVSTSLPSQAVEAQSPAVTVVVPVPSAAPLVSPAGATTVAAAPASNSNATIINHYYDKILINQAAAANTAVAAAATAAAAAASAAVSAAVTVTSIQQQQQLNQQQQSKQMDNLNESNSSVKSNGSTGGNKSKVEPLKVVPVVASSNQKTDTQTPVSSNVEVAKTGHPQMPQMTATGPANANYPLSSSVNGNVSASPSSNYLSMPSASNSSFGFGQQQPPQQMFQNIYQPQIMTAPLPLKANNMFDLNDFNHQQQQQQEAFGLYPQQTNYNHQLLAHNLPQQQQQLMGHGSLVAHQQMYQQQQANRGGLGQQQQQQLSASLLQQQFDHHNQALQNQQQLFNQQTANKLLAAAAATAAVNSLQSNKMAAVSGNQKPTAFPIAPGPSASTAKPPTLASANQHGNNAMPHLFGQNPAAVSTNSPLMNSYQQAASQQQSKQDFQYFNFNNFSNHFSNPSGPLANLNPSNGNNNNNNSSSNSNSNNFFQNNFMSHIASLSLNQQQQHHHQANQFSNQSNNNINSLFSSAISPAVSNMFNLNPQQQLAAQFSLNSIGQQPQQQQQQRQTPITPSSSASSTNTSINHLIQQQQKSQFENANENSFLGNNFEASYFQNALNKQSVSSVNTNSGNTSSGNAFANTINRPGKQQQPAYETAFSNNSSFSNNSGYHQQASHEQIKCNLPSVTPPMSLMAANSTSSFFNTNTASISSKNIICLKNLFFFRIFHVLIFEDSGGNSAINRLGNYSLEPHQYHQQMNPHYHAAFNASSGSNAPPNYMPPPQQAMQKQQPPQQQQALLPQPPQQVMGSHFKEQQQAATAASSLPP